MTLNSYRDPELRDRRSVFVRHPLSTVLAVVVGAFLLLAPIGARFGRTDHVVVRTAPLPGGVIDAGVFFAETTTTSAVASPTVVATTVEAITAVTTPAPETTEAPVITTAETAEKSAPTTVRRPATSAAKAKTTTTTKPKTTTSATKAATTAATAAAQPKPTTTAAKPTTTVTTAKPTTTTTVAPPTVYSSVQSEAVIRQVWPDDLESQAVAIATRESGLRNVAHNYCCYGLFQINYTPHKQWLASLGVVRPEQLYDPTVNATVAYRLYLLSGWAPWGG
jgi:hypothetical protein